MRKQLYIGVLWMICQWLFVMDVKGAAITMADLPYLCDFEDDTENANWSLNPFVNTITTTNRWIIGKATSYTGEKSLYVSKDGGKTNLYAATNNVLLAYRDITLEAGDYDVAYDWMGLGNKTKGYLKIIFVDELTNSLKCLGNATLPSYAYVASPVSVQLMGKDTSLVNGDAWRHIQARVTIPKALKNSPTTRLLFVWVNTDVTKPDSLTTIAIDNFQLAKASPTGDYPSNIHVTTSLGSSEISWEGSADSYEVLYRKRGVESFVTIYAASTSVTLTGMMSEDYGAYEFWISGFYTDAATGEITQTVYTVFPTVYLYETDCFDALNMYNAEFEYGTWQYGNTTGLVKNPQGYDRVDFGPGDVRSRHTTHFDFSEVDPRTVIKNSRGDTTACLKTVPKGEFGSVRLGNWNKGSEYESMTFHYTVESQSMAVLLIHYAMVLENPNHRATEQPRFTLDVFDESGVSIDTECASVDFHAPTADEWNDPEVRAIWHEVLGGASDQTVHWQEWKTIGISMESYVGHTLTITLTSYDCDQGGHFGYAYFMLNCSRSDVDGLPWGEGSSTRMFTAPEGFDYAWFNRLDKQFTDTIRNTDPTISPYITDEGRFFYVQESDTNTYLCHVTYPTNPECGYWFDASAKPHTPKAELEFQWAPANCTNGYLWWNRCHVVLTNQQTGEIEHRYDKQLENCFLLFEDGTEQSIKYVEDGTYVPMPDEGGTVKVGVWTGISVDDQLFADTVWYEYTVPSIGELETHLYDTICRGESVVFPEGSRDKYSDSGTYMDSLKSLVTGCDSVVKLHLCVHEPIMAEAYDTICPGTSYSFAGRTLTNSGKYTGLFTSLVTGCDSVVTLYLTAAPQPRTTLLSSQLCSDEKLTFLVSDAFYADYIHVRVSGMNDTTERVRRDGYQLALSLENQHVGPHSAIVELTMPWCETVWTDTLPFGVSISSGVIELHWNDVLVFLGTEYNGGLSFLSYQWYENGKAVAGATQSYYYNPSMDMDAEYTVKVTLSDGSEAWICPFTPAEAAKRQGIESTGSRTSNVRKILRNGALRIVCNGNEYTVTGQKVKE